MKTYHPQIRVILIKASMREEIAPGIPIIKDRYSDFAGLDITSFLGDGSSVQTTKSTRQPSGAFSIHFIDQPHPELLESIYALIEPMDIIEIRMAHDSRAIIDGRVPLIMRGFVSSVTRQESMNGNAPQRSVAVTGHDFAKILQLYRIVYLAYTEMAESAMAEFKFFQAFAADQEKKNMSGGEFVQLLVDKIINPYMSNIASLSNPESLGAKKINAWDAESTIDGTVSAYAVSSFTDESLYNIMRTVLDIGAFNEMYLDDREDGPVLIVRPVPFKNVRGDFIQGDADSVSVPAIDIVSQQVSRSDEGVANYFWVTNSRGAMMVNQDYKAMAQFGDKDSFVLFDYLNCRKSIFGIRKLEIETVLSDAGITDSSAPKESSLAQESTAHLSWVETRRKLLADMNKDNVIFESGSLRLRGNEAIKAGMYLRILRGVHGTYMGEVYCHSVTHEFSPYAGFFTTVNFDRGTLFIERSQRENALYLQEIEAQGAL